MWLQALMGIGGAAYGAKRANEGKPLIPTVETPKAATPTKSNAEVVSGYLTNLPNGRLTADKIVFAAQGYNQRFPELENVDPVLTAAMAMTESGGNTVNLNPYASRYEEAFHKRYVPQKSAEYATSYGIMQVMLQTADELWLAGYNKFPRPNASTLSRNADNLYYGMALQAQLKKRKANNGGNPSDVKWLVMSYNGGYNQDNSQTQNHYKKVAANRENLVDMIA